MTKQAQGTFEVKLTPLPPDADAGDSALGRLAIDKQFRGDLEGTSKGQMVAARTAIATSAGYVALERVRASLDGRTGTFVLQHSGTMTRGESQLSVTVVPDSGTDGLAGLAGSMKIINEGGRHSYEFDYALPELP
jgi:hypothetical protein